MTDWLGITTADAKPTKTDVQTDTGFPSKADARFAQENDFGYGTGIEPYVQGNVARIYHEPTKAGSLSQAVEAPSSNFNLRNTPELREKIQDLFARNGLAINRSAIASLGFDPSQINLQLLNKPMTTGGIYDPNIDRTWAQVVDGNESVITHETIHRGLEQLRSRSPEAKRLLDTVPEETLVRYMMYKVMGDPEGKRGDIDAKQRAEGIQLGDGKQFKKTFDRLEEIAVNLRKEQRPRGPR